MSLISEISPLARLWEEPLSGLEIATGGGLLAIDVLQNGTEAHEIRTTESRGNGMSRRNIA
jgi:hypothetical protein